MATQSTNYQLSINNTSTRLLRIRRRQWRTWPHTWPRKVT